METNASHATQERSPEQRNGRSAQQGEKQYLEEGTMREAEGAGEDRP